MTYKERVREMLPVVPVTMTDYMAMEMQPTLPNEHGYYEPSVIVEIPMPGENAMWVSVALGRDEHYRWGTDLVTDAATGVRHCGKSIKHDASKFAARHEVLLDAINEVRGGGILPKAALDAATHELFNIVHKQLEISA